MSIKAGKVWGQTELIHANGVLEFHRIEFRADHKCSEHKHQFKSTIKYHFYTFAYYY
jgi:hypothetical protein